MLHSHLLIAMSRNGKGIRRAFAPLKVFGLYPFGALSLAQDPLQSLGTFAKNEAESCGDDGTEALPAQPSLNHTPC